MAKYLGGIKDQNISVVGYSSFVKIPLPSALKPFCTIMNSKSSLKLL